ncbi:MAG: GntR family transcriptional regulator [Armatimonadetes bacterium]|nr:GntR family transcriptional regulator [Armatimonadota bacterium]MDW8122798.1 GntR family transcriptional regulator [Armatimonadota bacterium]
MPLRAKQKVTRSSARRVSDQVKDLIRASIEAGELRPGEPLPGRLELCRLYGTNRVAVDRAVRDLVREGLLVSIRGKGTFVAERTQSVPSEVLTFGVVWSHPVTFQDNIYWGPLLRGISYGASQRGVRVLFRQCPPDSFADLILKGETDGLIVLAPHTSDQQVLQTLRQKGIPFVATSSAFDDRKLPCVDTDNFDGVRQVLEHLWSLGHSHIAIVNWALESTDLLRRWQAFQELMGKAGYTLDPRWTVLSPSYQWGAVQQWLGPLENWLREVPLPSAIFCCAYEMALAVIKVLRNLKIPIPDRVSVVGFDDPASAAFLDPALTTVRQPLEALGMRAVEKLYEALERGVRPDGTELLKPKLIVRDSTGPPCPPVSSSIASKQRKEVPDK